MTDEQADDETRRYGTLEGVFVPTLLTILGVILFLRTGWVVGNAGLLGSIGIITLAFVITGVTALSLASISTNVAPEAGGAYALVARSFGVEAGGAIGISLYLSQSLVIVLYAFGFRDGWITIFPGHPPLGVDAGIMLAPVIVALVGTKAAFRIQFVILGIVGVALGTLAVAAVTQPIDASPPMLGSFPGAPEGGFPGTDIWAVSAVFFPATTGIMAGLNMSGELRDPRRSILRGTLGAVGVSVVIYLAVAVWLAFAVPVEELVSDYVVLVERSAWGPAVLAGLPTATFSSALASLVGAPRILHALAADRVTPAATWLGRRSSGGDPRNALLVTIAVVGAGVLLRDLNVIAPLITMVFLLTKGAINVAVLALLAVGGVLFWLGRRDVERPVTDIRRAMLVALAQWAKRTAKGIGATDERTWAPRLLIAVSDPEDIERARRWLPELAAEGGPVRIVTVTPDASDNGLREATQGLRDDLEEAAIETSAPDAELGDAGQGPIVSLLAAGDEDDPQAANLVVSGFPDQPEYDGPTRLLLRNAFEANAGVVLVPPRPPDHDGESPEVALWVRAEGPRWHLERNLPHSDLALLLAYRIAESWNAKLALVTAVARPEDASAAEQYLDEIVERARLPGPPAIHVITTPFAAALEEAPSATLHVLALSSQTDFDWLREVRERLDTPCIFVRDSGVENAFA